MPLNVLLVVPEIRIDDKPFDFPFWAGIFASIIDQKGGNVAILDLNALRMNNGGNHLPLNIIKKQIEERKLFNYPPYNRLIGITLKHKNQIKLDEAAQQLVVLMRKSFGSRVLGPEYPSISRIRNYYHKGWGI